ncbi:zinc ribbon domain-containing protein [Paenibacillus sp. 1001270B_150601_E10]|uniref:zinc ribbon domain-containing protein n=1 Tax=Paenibacillus sp. 1001270B_150601_E10 TaxID=2787079 RepID=UPI00189F2AE2|nr:zinc ribbon domain-containing protein [Paenibacillus sp. 1001270B_150601_E10]
MEQTTFCQSCGMPLNGSEELLGSNADGSKNEEYCTFCYKDGAFIADVSMEEMIEFCVPHMVEGNQGMTEEAARSSMKAFFPKLKRWTPAHR